MKKSLTLKLTLYFFSALFVFIALVGALFWYLFQERSEKFYTQRLTSIAVTLAENVEENKEFSFDFMPEDKHANHHGNSIYTKRTFNADKDKPPPPKNHGEDVIARRLQELNRLSQGEVWIFDKKTNSLNAYGKENSESLDELPHDAGKTLSRVLSGEKVVSRNFSSLLSSPSITVGVPIMDKNGDIKGALLLHGKISGLKAVQQEAFKLLAAALCLGLFITVILSFVLAKKFVKPLKQMETFATELAKEKYYLRSGIKKEDEIGSLAKSLDLLAARLSDIENEKLRLEKMRQDFLTSVSHELKTPITVLRGILEMFTAGLVKTDEQKNNYFKQMEKNIIGLGRLVQDLFELSRLQNADFKIEKSELNLNDPLNDAIQSAKQMGMSKNISINVKDNKIPFVMQGDYGRLKQMFLIVLDNAVKFSPIDGEITVEKEIGENYAKIFVSDKGEGIKKEDLPHIFEKFHKQKNKNDEGTGLGLAIAKEIARRHFIEIICESEEGEGAKFMFVIEGNLQ